MKVFVRSLTNQKYELEVDPAMSVQTFKEEIHKVHKLGEPDTQKLIYSGKILKDDQTLDDAKIKDGGFVVLMTKKPDPKKEKKSEENEMMAQPLPAAAPAAPAPVVEAVAPAVAAAPGGDEDDDVDEEDDEHGVPIPDDILAYLNEGGAGDMMDVDPQQAGALIEQISNLIAQNPALAGEIVEHIVQNHPELAPQFANPDNIAQALQQPEVMLRVLEVIGHLAEAADEEGGDEEEHVIELGEQEMAAIQRVSSPFKLMFKI
jgi:hypothetical protein